MHAILIEDNGWHAAQCLEIDIASQGNIEEEALQNLLEALALHFQDPVNSSMRAFEIEANAESLKKKLGSWSAHEVFSLDPKFTAKQNEESVNPVSKQIGPPSLEELLSAPNEGNTFRKIRFKLESIGFTEVRQLNNHAKFVRREGDEIRTALLPHYLQICPAVLRSVLRQAGLSKEEFDKL